VSRGDTACVRELRNSRPRAKGEAMQLTPLGIIRQLGVGRFLRFLYHLPNFLKLLSRLVNDPRVALRSKLVPLGILAYLILPTDFLPDVLLGFGQLDDLAVILLGLKMFFRLCPPDVVQEHVKAIAAQR